MLVRNVRLLERGRISNHNGNIYELGLNDIYVFVIESFIYLFIRTNCPKVNPPTILLSDEERKIWEQAEVINEKNTELVEAILSRYGFTEVD